MASEVGRGKSLAYTSVAGNSPTPATGPINDLQSCSYKRTTGNAPFLRGTSRVDSHYQGKVEGFITVEIADYSKFATFAEGQKFTNVELVMEGAKDSAGVAVGDGSGNHVEPRGDHRCGRAEQEQRGQQSGDGERDVYPEQASRGSERPDDDDFCRKLTTDHNGDTVAMSAETNQAETKPCYLRQTMITLRMVRSTAFVLCRLIGRCCRW